MDSDVVSALQVHQLGVQVNQKFQQLSYFVRHELLSSAVSPKLPQFFQYAAHVVCLFPIEVCYVVILHSAASVSALTSYSFLLAFLTISHQIVTKVFADSGCSELLFLLLAC